MTIRIKGLVARNNGGDGIRIEGDVHVDAEDLLVEGNGGSGIAILRHAPLLEQLGLPRDTDPQALARLLHELQGIRPAKREEHAAKSSLLRKVGGGAAGMVAFAANVATLAASPQVSQLIQRLSS
ncbi:hypothetical protein [Lysobacter sp. TY2-98]|uniref:hypothetical protein n=1 Tax=Lysobacter sp. TY2-98 TaxID=2290922 RepID=UPI0013B36D2A|nr:hypothetical protein [Lysobacter sp. TY2-98]